MGDGLGTGRDRQPSQAGRLDCPRQGRSSASLRRGVHNDPPRAGEEFAGAGSGGQTVDRRTQVELITTHHVLSIRPFLFIGATQSPCV